MTKLEEKFKDLNIESSSEDLSVLSSSSAEVKDSNNNCLPDLNCESNTNCGPSDPNCGPSDPNCGPSDPNCGSNNNCGQNFNCVPNCK